MPRFFIDKEQMGGGVAEISGEDARHIAKSLRMKPGEQITLCDLQGFEYSCLIDEISDSSVLCKIESKSPCAAEPSIRVTLYQGMPKGDKLETIIQKCTELGISRIVPVTMSRSIARLDEKKSDKKLVRWQKIALEAAKQSQRGAIPEIGEAIGFDRLCSEIVGHDSAILFYEKSDAPLGRLLNKGCKDFAIIIGPEGGFDPDEVERLRQCGAVVSTLGKRILRTETAGMAALSAIMFATGNMD